MRTNLIKSIERVAAHTDLDFEVERKMKRRPIVDSIDFVAGEREAAIVKGFSKGHDKGPREIISR